jgi:lauroyl/myristoyl acyltransferase
MVRLAEPFAHWIWRDRRNKVMQRMYATRCLGMTQDQAQRSARKYISNSMFRAVDDVLLCRPSFRRMLRCTSIQGLDWLGQARSAGRGVIVLTAHLYASRVAKRYLASIGYPMLTVRSRRHTGDLESRVGRGILHERYNQFLHEVIQDEVDLNDPDCALRILQRLRSGGMVNLHFDALARSRPVEWPFFGTQTRFSSGTFDIVRLAGCAVVPMLCLGRSTDFRIAFSPMLDIVPAQDRAGFVAANLPSFVEVLEKQIEANPEEWTPWNRS